MVPGAPSSETVHRSRLKPFTPQQTGQEQLKGNLELAACKTLGISQLGLRSAELYASAKLLKNAIIDQHARAVCAAKGC